MWPFFRKQKQVQELPAMTDLVDDRNLNDLSENSAILRVWLPEAGKTALDEVVKRAGMVAAKYLREFFVVYLYGLHELLKMKATERGLYYIPAPEPLVNDPSCKRDSSRVMYSRAASVECIPGLGKNIIPLKVFIPQRIKDDLQELADKADVSLSQLTREILVSHFFGHTFWPEKLRNWSDDQERVGVEWEQGARENEVSTHSNESQAEADGNSVVRWL